MAQSASLTFLVANERAEEIKLTTISMRGFYPGCCVEAVYSVDEALEYAGKQDWHGILLDEHLSGRNGFDILPELRKRAPAAAIIWQAAAYDMPIVRQALQVGADYCVCKKSPAFLTELPIAMKQMLDKRDLRLGLGVALERYRRLTESLDGVVYELDAHGRFISVSPSVSSLLGYQPDEMIGAHYMTIVHPEAWQAATHRFNERRTAARATRNVAVKLVTKHRPHETAALIDAELTATGLYNHRQTYMGTIGLLRSIGGRQQEGSASEGQLQYSERLLKFEQSLAPLAAELTRPLNEILRNTEALLKQSQSLQVEDGLQRIARHAVRAMESVKLLSPLIQPKGADVSADESVGVSPEAGTRQSQESISAFLSRPCGSPGPSVSDKPAALRVDRRLSPRIDLLADASVKFNDVTYRGIALNISLGGLYMILDGQIAVSANQSIQIGLVSGPAILEVSGNIREVRHAADRKEPSVATYHMGLAIEFRMHGPPEEPVLASLIDELRERSISITVAASLSSEGATDARFQTESVAHSGGWTSTKQAGPWTPDSIQNSACLANPSDYWRLLNHIYHLIGSLENEERVLDAGCGNGALGAFLLIQEAYRLRITSGRNIPRTHYVGMDFPATALAHSKFSLDILSTELRGYILATGMSQHLLRTSFCSADLNRTLPFHNAQFDRIVCNLVIGYLKDPLSFLYELMRVLTPNGMLVLTSLNPQAEVPVRFTEPAHHPWELDNTGNAEWLWGNLVQLKQAEREGMLRSPDKQELKSLMTACGAGEPLIYSAFADQAYIVVAGKQERAT